jgi:hypothetical protein
MQTSRETSLLSDPAFPRLGEALDAGVMLGKFREHLRPTGNAAREILSCRLSRIRYREARRCVLQYTLRVSEPVTGGERDVTVSGLMYAKAGKAERAWHELAATRPEREIPEAMLVFEPVSLVPDLGMLVQIFPYDYRLPSLPRLAAGPPVGLEPRLLVRLGPGDWSADAWGVEAVRYRERLGAVLRYTARARDPQTGETAEKRFYAKVYRDDAGRRTRQQIEDIEKVAGKDFDVVRPVSYLDDLKVLVLEESPGFSLEEILCSGRGVVRAAGEVGRALAAFNQMDYHPARRHTLEDQIADLEKAARTLCWACPRLATDVKEIIGAVAAGLKGVAPRPTHRDLKPDHVLLRDGRVTFIDLDSFAAADPVIDPALLLARLAAVPYLLPVPRHRTLRAARAFADEYFSRVPASWRGRLHLHFAGATLEVAYGFFRRQLPGWPEKITALVNEARMTVDGDGSMMKLLDGDITRDGG